MKAGIVLTYMDKIRAFIRKNRLNFIKFILIADCFAISLISPQDNLQGLKNPYACYSVKGALSFNDSFFQALKNKLADQNITLIKETYCPKNSSFIITNTQHSYPYLYTDIAPVYLLNETKKTPIINPNSPYILAFTAKDENILISARKINFNDTEKAAEIITDTIITKDFLSDYFFIRPMTDHGLGNQLFSIAAQIAYAKRFSKKFYLVDNGAIIYSVFNFLDQPVKVMPIYLTIIQLMQKTTKGPKVNANKKHKQLFIDDSFFAVGGYLQSYFNIYDAQAYLQKKIQFIPFTEEENKELAEKIQQENSVCMHVRLGDYISHEYPILFWSNYFDRAIDYIKNKVKNPAFYVFSDDYNAVKDYDFGVPVQLVNHNFGSNSFRDMQLMSLCKHNIISNSTFSWWAAFLNKNPNKIVIYPDIWLKWDPQWLEEMRVPGWVEIKSDIYIDKKTKKIVYPSKL